jgi:hypothetical protein
MGNATIKEHIKKMVNGVMKMTKGGAMNRCNDPLEEGYV